MAEYGLEESTWQLYVDGQSSYFDEFGREMDQWEEKNPGPGEAFTRGLETDGVLRFAHPRGYAWMQERNAYRMDKYLETVDRGRANCAGTRSGTEPSRPSWWTVGLSSRR